MKTAVIGTSKGAAIASLLMSVGGMTLNEVLNPPAMPESLQRYLTEKNKPIIQRELENRLRRKARRVLHHRLLKLYLAEARKRADRPKRNVAIAEFKTLWNKAQADWRRHQRESA